MEILNIDESHELERCEVVIKQGLQTFIEVGQALMTIREKRLYRIGFKTFEDYCVGRWGMVQQSATRLIRAYETVTNLQSEPMGSVLPQSERQTRPLTSLEPEIQKEVWKEVVQTHGNKITYTKVQTVVNDWKPVNFEVKEAKANPMFSPDIEVIIEDKKLKAHVSNNSGENEWYTPECYIESAKKVMGNIDLDPASSEIANQTVNANLFYSQEEDGLSKEWFGKAHKSYEVVEELFTPMLKYTKINGEINIEKPPYLKSKVQKYNNEWKCEIYDEDSNMLFPNDNDSSVSPLEILKCGKKAYVACVLICGGIWFTNGKFAVTWELSQAVTQKPKERVLGQRKCLINLKPKEKELLKIQIQEPEEFEEQPKLKKSNVEDSDGEDDIEESLNVITEENTKVVEELVTNPEDISVASTEKKKKIVRKKNS